MEAPDDALRNDCGGGLSAPDGSLRGYIFVLREILFDPPDCL